MESIVPLLLQGVVGTTNGTIWYVNWTGEESEFIRIVSGHQKKVNLTKVEC